jgi:hypothetical protein
MHKVATTRIYFVLCALLTLPVFGCGDDGAKDPEPEPMPSGGSGGGGGGASTGEVLADCEKVSTTTGQHDGYLKHETKGWEIAWFTYSDNKEAMAAGKATSMIMPVEMTPFVCVQDADTARSYVFNAKGGPFNLWGAGMGFNMQIMGDLPPASVDLTAYKGVKFWAKVNAATTGSVRLKLKDVQTTPTADGGTCTGANGICNNNFGFVLSTISTSWAQFTVPFTDLKQESWSSEMFATPQIDKVIGFQFQVGKTAFDYSVDNFELYQ